MTLANGRTYLAIPGPSVMPEAVLRAMHRSAPNIYEGPLHDMVDTLSRDLPRIARTEGRVAMYVGNGHAGWEAALANTVGRGDRVLALATGAFGHGWASHAETLGLDVERMDFGRRSPVEPDRLAERLAADDRHEIRAVLAVQVDTATSLRSDLAAMRAAMDRVGHPALLMVDAIACLGCDRLEMDGWGVDVVVTGSQKGLMTPPGMAFVFFNERAEAARDRLDQVSAYWDWRPRTRPEIFSQQFCGTAPTHHLHGLRVAVDMILEEGLEAVWDRHAHLARAVWTAVERWGHGGPVRLNVAEPAHRSHAVTTVRVGPPHGLDLRRWVEAKAGVTLGIGLGMQDESDPRAEGAFRIGHMGHVNAQMVMGALGAIGAGLAALDVPHGEGALDAAATVLSEA